MNTSSHTGVKPPLVSVVIPTFNRAYCISDAIESVLAQTHQNVEAIVVDDGSTDNTRGLLASRFGDDERVRYFYQSNAGVAGARNTGFRAVRGDFVALLDSDDCWHPWKLELQVAALQFLPEAGMVWTDMEAVDAEGHSISPRYLRTMYDAYRWFEDVDLFQASYPLSDVAPRSAGFDSSGRLFFGDIFSQMVMGNLVHTSTVLLRRHRLESVGGFDESLKFSGEDYDFHLRTCREGPVAFINLASIRYRVGHTDQLTDPRYQQHFSKNFLATISRVLEQDRERIRLPQSMLRALVAGAHEWVAQSAMDVGDNATARRHFARSLWQRPWQTDKACRLLLCCLPSATTDRLRNVYRHAKAGVLHMSRCGGDISN